MRESLGWLALAVVLISTSANAGEVKIDDLIAARTIPSAQQEATILAAKAFAPLEQHRQHAHIVPAEQVKAILEALVQAREPIAGAVRLAMVLAIEQEPVAVKAALFDVADLLHQWADVHRRLTSAASYLHSFAPRAV